MPIPPRAAAARPTGAVRPSRSAAVLAFGVAVAACGEDRRAAPVAEVAPIRSSDTIALVATGPFTVSPLGLAELEARAAGLPTCGPLPDLDTARLQATRLRPLSRGTLWLPRNAVDQPDDVPDTTFQKWRRPDDSDITVMMRGEAGSSTGFGIGADHARETIVGESACALRVAGRATRVHRVLFVARAGSGIARDTQYVAFGDVPVAFDSTLGVGIIADGRAGRDTLLASLLTLRVAPR